MIMTPLMHRSAYAVSPSAMDAALLLAREHGFDVEQGDDALIARFAAGEDVRNATAALNRVLCIAGGIRIHALAPRRRSLETLYRNAALAAAPAAMA